MSTIRTGLFADVDQACQVLAAVKSRKTDRRDLLDVRQVITEGCAVRLVDQAGATVGGYVVQPFGRSLWITAAAGRADVPLCEVIDQHATEQARRGGYDGVVFRTERAGLVKRTWLLGYELFRKQQGIYYMRKSIQ